MKKKALNLTAYVAIIAIILTSLAGCSNKPSAKEEEKKFLFGPYIVTSDEDNRCSSYPYYPRRIYFNSDGTGWFDYDAKGWLGIYGATSHINFQYTVDKNNYVKVTNTEIEQGNTTTPAVDFFPNISGYLEGNEYVLEKVNVRYEAG